MKLRLAVENIFEKIIYPEVVQVLSSTTRVFALLYRVIENENNIYHYWKTDVER